MTVKEKIMTVVDSLDDDTSIDHAIDRLYLLRKIELGLQQADSDDVISHEEFMGQIDDVQKS